MHFPFKRFCTSLFSFCLAGGICFAILQFAPGNRADYDSAKNFESARVKSFSPKPTPSVTTFLKDCLKGNFGESLTFKKDVKEVFALFTKVSLVYWGISLLMTYSFGFIICYYFSQQKNRRTYEILRPLLLFLYEMPTFLVGLLLLYIANQSLSPTLFKMEEVTESNKSFLLYFSHLWAPVLTYLLFTVPAFLIQMDIWIRDEKQKEYLTALKAKGFSPFFIFTRHLIPNLFPLILTSIPLTLRNLFILSLAVEVTFQIHGFGYLSQLSFKTRDTSLLFFTFLSISFFEIQLAFFSDLLVLGFARGRGRLLNA